MLEAHDLIDILDSVSYAVVAIDLDGNVLCLNRPARLFLTKRGRDIDGCIGGPAEVILPLAAPLAREALKTTAFHKGYGRIVDRGRDLFFEITPLFSDKNLAGTVVSLQRPERFEELATQLDGYQNMAMQLKAVFDSSSDGIWVTDGQGRVLEINRASELLNAIKAQDVIGKPMDTLLRNKGFVNESVTLKVLQHKRQESIIQDIQRTGKQLLVTGTPVLNDKSEVVMVVVNERDITDLNKMRKSLEDAKREKAKVQDELAGLTMLELEGQGVIMESPAMRQVTTTALKLAQLNASNILLLGESGTGKSMFAKFIHSQSPRKDAPFMSVNCAALPETLIEAELFGYEKGAFTGANASGKAGLMELAGNGTFFFDEVGEIPLTVQAKLLKCLDEKEYMPVGGASPKPLRCTIVAATNRDLEDMVTKKQFREDLFYRLNALVLRIPPLRERPEDIYELASHFLDEYCKRYDVRKTMSGRGVERLLHFNFPGNVRELRNIIKKGVVMTDEESLDDFLDQALGDSSQPIPETTGFNLTQALAEVERAYLVRARQRVRSTREMARLLGLSQATVVRKLQKHGL